MKIIFICSSLEPGRDGVGDYTRRLAGELIRQGNLSSILSLNDKYALSKTQEVQQSEGIDIPVLRLPYGGRWKQRVIDAKAYINEFNPDWLSLQFVIFGFHAKGLPFGLGNRLAAIGKGHRWHIMFHELWIGMAVESPVKQKYWGLLQKNIIKKLIQNLKPLIIHTQSGLYQAQLNKLGFNSEILRLFGNVPVHRSANYVNQNPETNKLFTLVIFGTMHPGAPVRQFAKEVAMYAEQARVQFLLKIVGRSGPQLNNWINEFKSVGLPVKIMGEQPKEVISQTLKAASFGISTSAYMMIEKSGTVAAMQEHGLPIICVSGPYTPMGIKTFSGGLGIQEYRIGNFEECFVKTQRPVLINRLDTTVAQLLKSLK
jgi:glycosyltransferase involved in cell wall biosynthesis